MAESSSRKRSLPPEFEDLIRPNKEQKRVRFPKGKKVKLGDEVPVVQQPAENVKSETDAQLAAKERALRRHQIPPTQEDTEMLHDISAAEVHYKENETFVDDGIHIEPFNLDQENEEGFFDAAGNYVEYINKNEIKDAWLDNVEVNSQLAKRRVEIANEDENIELSSKEIAMMKGRMADVLLPGETVLQALRRLKGSSTSKKEKMSAETKVIFDRLTEDAMRLMENGDYNVYEENKEVFQREAEGYEKLAHARGEGASSNTGQVDDSFDIFAEDDESANANPNSGGSDLVSGPSSNGRNQPSESGSLQNDFVYDESSGYYYSSSLGYYYDPSSGLYCSASGQWYSYKEETMMWEEVQAIEAAVSQ